MTIEELIKEEIANEHPTNKTHHDICVALGKFADDRNLPYWLVGLVAISSTAHKKEAFALGYKSINLEHAEKVFQMTAAVAERFHRPSLRVNVRVALGCSRFVHAKGSMGTFIECLENTKEMPRLTSVKQFNALLFGGRMAFDHLGRIALNPQAQPPKKKEKEKELPKTDDGLLDITEEVVILDQDDVVVLTDKCIS